LRSMFLKRWGMSLLWMPRRRDHSIFARFASKKVRQALSRWLRRGTSNTTGPCTKNGSHPERMPGGAGSNRRPRAFVRAEAPGWHPCRMQMESGACSRGVTRSRGFNPALMAFKPSAWAGFQIELSRAKTKTFARVPDEEALIGTGIAGRLGIRRLGTLTAHYAPNGAFAEEKGSPCSVKYSNAANATSSSQPDGVITSVDSCSFASDAELTSRRPTRKRCGGQIHRSR